jgi:Zn-dependent metalloprotease
MTRTHRSALGSMGVQCSVLPPHILENIVRNGDPVRRERALGTLKFDMSFRSARLGQATVRAFGGPPAFGASGRVARTLLGGPPVKDRTIFDGQKRQRLPGVPVRTEDDPDTNDAAVNEAFTFMGDTFDFFLEAYERNSIDDASKSLHGTVHYGRDYDNAFWDGRQMVYGDGDGIQFEPFTRSLDVVGHELTHGITESEAGLIYWAQSGALNESVSDVFGSLVKQYVMGQKATDADWLIGAELFIPGSVQGLALRSMAAPGTAYDDPVLGKDPQPAHMQDYDPTWSDNAGVHINSGIPNHAFYLAATSLGGNAWEDAGLIWYQALLSPLLRPTAQFTDFARITVLQARRLYGRSSDEAGVVRDAWSEVGVRV